jgi:hypothetical protein
VRQISSQSTFGQKYAAPTFAVIVAALLALVTFVTGLQEGFRAIIPHLFAVLFFSGIAYLLVITQMQKIVDEVYDDGDALVVRNGDHKERILFSDISNVEWWPDTIQRVTVTLRKPCVFGNRIVFLAPYRIWPYAAHPDVKDLIGRINQPPQPSKSPPSAA